MIHSDKTIFQSFVNKAATELGISSTFTFSESEIVDWMDNENPPTTEVLNSKIDELKLAYDAQEYARQRKAEYPDWGSQLNKIYDDGLTKWKAEMVDPVKAKFPKP
jgi:hypothetical protein